MSGIPRPALLLGAAGLLPFLWGAATHLSPALGATTAELLGARLAGTALLAGYGSVILCFMAGVLWGFASRGERAAPYVLSVLPALWVFFLAGGGGAAALSALLVGFLLLLTLDAQFGRWGLTPPWWMRLRLPLTAVVAACLAVGLYA